MAKSKIDKKDFIKIIKSDNNSQIHKNNLMSNKKPWEKCDQNIFWENFERTIIKKFAWDIDTLQANLEKMPYNEKVEFIANEIKGAKLKNFAMFYKFDVDISDITEMYLKWLEINKEHLSIMLNKSNVNNPPSVPTIKTGFENRLNDKGIIKLYKSLTDEEYILSDERNFKAVFSINQLPEDFRPIIWIKKQTRNKNKVSKKAIFDLLKLTGVKEYEDYHKINYLFNDNNGNPINVKTQNLYDNKKNSKNTSEFYNDIQKMIN